MSVSEWRSPFNSAPHPKGEFLYGVSPPLEDSTEFFNGSRRSETTFILLFWDTAQMNLITSFRPFMEISLKLPFSSMIHCQQTTSAKCTQISSIGQCWKVYLFNPAVEVVCCNFCHDKDEWLSVHTTYTLKTVPHQYVSPHSQTTLAGVTSDYSQQCYFWLRSCQNYNAEKSTIAVNKLSVHSTIKLSPASVPYLAKDCCGN